VLEIITCGATHAFLPTMQHNENAVRAQISIAADSYRRFFGSDPKGIWLPECGYYPGLETILDKEGLSYFFVDTHGILFAEERPEYGVFAPLICRDAPVAAFGRDAESSRSVWSADEGYPGHPHYREFYRDIGFDLDIDYIRPYIDPAWRQDPDRDKILPYHRPRFSRKNNRTAGSKRCTYRRRARRQFPFQPGTAGEAPGAAHGPASAHCGALRRRTVRALVV
jgi:predicted glycosyl hydrolase (DUF1957 family)